MCMDNPTGLKVGTKAPDFTAPLVYPEHTEETTLSDLLEDKPVLLTFYTNDFSPDCITEWCSFRDYEWFASNDEVTVVGVSISRESVHRKFIDIFDIGYPLFFDRDLAITDAYNVKYNVFHVFKRPRRSCFLIGQDQTILYKWVSEHPVDPTRDTPNMKELHTKIKTHLGN